MKLDFVQALVEAESSKIVLVVLDGLGGLASEPGGQTELERAHTPSFSYTSSALTARARTEISNARSR